MGKLKTKVGTALLGAAVIDDILGVIILSVIIGMDGGGVSLPGVGIVLAKIAGFIALAFFFGFWVHKFFDFLVARYGMTHRLSIFGLALCFLFAFLAEQFGIADITGAYIAGLALSNSKAEHYIEQKSHVLEYMFFSPIFFVSVGLHASFDGMSANTVLFAVLLLVVAVASKFAGSGLGARACKFTTAESIQIGSGMISRGEVAIIMATKGLAVGLITATYFSSVIIIIIATTLVTPLLLKLAFKGEKKAPVGG